MSDWAGVDDVLLAEIVAFVAEREVAVRELAELSTSLFDEADVFDRDRLAAVIASRDGLIAQAERALSRLAAGTYGSCEQCGRPISAGRLRAIPMATTDPHCFVRPL